MYKKPGVLLAACLMVSGACSVRLDWPEHEVEVYQRVEGAAGVAGAVIVVDQVELMACEPSVAARLGELLVPSAAAHGEAGPTLLAPHMAMRLGESAAYIGRLTPPPGRWCGARVLLRAGGDGLIGEEAGAMRGASMAVDLEGGELLRTGAAAERQVSVALELDDAEAARGRLVLVWSMAGVAEAAAGAGDDPAGRARAALGAMMEGVSARWEVSR